jgi:hypothetical protein
MEQKAKLAHQRELREVQRNVAAETASTEAHRIVTERGRAKGMERAKWQAATPFERAKMTVQKLQTVNARVRTSSRQFAPRPLPVNYGYDNRPTYGQMPPQPAQTGGIPRPSLVDHNTFGMRTDVNQRGPILKKEWFG